MAYRTRPARARAARPTSAWCGLGSRGFRLANGAPKGEMNMAKTRKPKHSTKPTAEEAYAAAREKVIQNVLYIQELLNDLSAPGGNYAIDWSHVRALGDVNCHLEAADAILNRIGR